MLLCYGFLRMLPLSRLSPIVTLVTMCDLLSLPLPVYLSSSGRGVVEGGKEFVLVRWGIVEGCCEVGVMATKIRPVYCGNFEYDARQSEIERLFKEYGRVDRVDMKTGFSFVYMDDERDAEDAIRHLDNMEFGRQRRRLSVEWAKQGDGAIRRREDARRSNTKLRPSKTLFVVNFDPINTRVRDLERHFEPYGKLVRVQIRKNFGFVQYETQDEATKALECTNMSKVTDRVITVEYAAREDGEPPSGGRGSSPGRYRGPSRGSPPSYGRDRSPVRGSGRNRSPPARSYRSRSPDYRPYAGSRR